MKSKLLFIILVIVLISSLFIISCGPGAPSAEEVITWKYNDQNPETGWGAQNAAIPMMDAMTKATNGRLQFEYYFGQSLTKGIDAWEGTKSGIADMSWCFFGYWGGMTSLMGVQSLPFMPWKDSKHASAGTWKLYEEYPEIQKQFSENKILFLWSTNPYFLITTNKQVKTPADMKGLKLRVIGGPPTEMKEQLGFSPMNVPMPDTYENLQKGVIDGMGLVWEAMYTFKQYEVCNYITLLPMYNGYFAWAANWDSWNKLSADVQKKLEPIIYAKGSETYGYNMFDTIRPKCEEAIKASGRNITWYEVPNSELVNWQNAIKPVYGKWITDRKAEGFANAQEIYDRAWELASK